MKRKSFKRAISFALLCSIITFPTITIHAQATQNETLTTQECAKAKQIAQRVLRSICMFFNSGNPQHVVNARLYLNSMNPPQGGFARLLNKIKASVATLINKMRSAKRCPLTSLEARLTQAFDGFGYDIKNVAQEVQTMGNSPEIQALAANLNEMPEKADKAFLRISGIQKKKLGMNVWRGKNL